MILAHGRGAVVANVVAAIVAASLLLVFYIGYHVLFEVAGGGRTVGKRPPGCAS